MKKLIESLPGFITRRGIKKGLVSAKFGGIDNTDGSHLIVKYNTTQAFQERMPETYKLPIKNGKLSAAHIKQLSTPTTLKQEQFGRTTPEKDCQGTVLKTGDIILYRVGERDHYRVVTINKRGVFLSMQKNGGACKLAHHDFRDWKKVGNIRSNPELVKDFNPLRDNDY